MDTELWQQVRKLFHDALELPEAERAAYLDQSCSDPTLRAEVESLLRFHDQGSDLMEDSPIKLLKDARSGQERDPWIGNFIGPYQVVAKVGEGGMGTVYRALRVEEQYLKQVAVKVIRPGISSSQHYLQRFRNERQIMASLDHPNIARLLDGGATSDGLPYFVMEFIEGQRIDDYCDQRKLSTAERLQLFRQVCGAVQYAHQRLVVHRDLKAGNILITENGVPKLLDFGIAKLLEPELFLQTTQVTGTLMKPMTPECASPEQFLGGTITTASDVYSLGALLYRLLTGHPPYRVEGRPLHELARAVSETEPLKPSQVIDRVEEETGDGGARVQLTPEYVSGLRDGDVEALRGRLSGDLDNILLKALRKEPERRYASVEQFSEDIGRHLDGMPVLARKDTIRYRTVKFVKRNRTGVAAGLLLLVVLLAGIATTSWQAHVARQQRRLAEQRFNDVRQLANSLVFDVDDAMADVPGTTAARRLLVDNAMRYLDSLAKEAKDDRSLQRELASGYLKLSDVQGSPYRANIGDTAGSMVNLRKAVAIREDLVREDPGNREDLFRLAVAYRRLGVMLVSTGELHPALDITQKGQTILEGLLQTEPRSFTLLDEMESIYETVGDIYGGNGLSANLGDTETALAYHRKALASAELRAQIAPGNVGALHGIGTYNIKVGDDLVKQGERAAALSSYNKALEIYKGLNAGGDSQRFQRQTSLLYTRIGDVHLMDGEPRSALADYMRAQEIAEKLAAADSQDALARSDATLGRGLLGKVYAELGETEKGQAMLNNAIAALEDAVARDPQRTDAYRALGLFYMWRGQVREKTGPVDAAIADHQRNASLLERIYNADPKDVEARVTLAATRVKIGGLMAKKGNTGDAMQAYQNALPDLEPFTAEKPFNIEALYAAADAYAHIGELVQRQAESAPSSPHQLELWRGARSWYEKSSVTWRKVRNPGKMTPTGFRTGEPGKAEAGLAACDAALAGPGRGQAKNATP